MRSAFSDDLDIGRYRIRNLSHRSSFLGIQIANDAVSGKQNRRITIRKNKNTFAKLQRERQKKRKADEKRQRKLERKTGAPDSFSETDDPPGDSGTDDGAETTPDPKETTDDATDQQI